MFVIDKRNCIYERTPHSHVQLQFYTLCTSKFSVMLLLLLLLWCTKGRKNEAKILFFFFFSFIRLPSDDIYKFYYFEYIAQDFKSFIQVVVFFFIIFIVFFVQTFVKHSEVVAAAAAAEDEDEYEQRNILQTNKFLVQLKTCTSTRGRKICAGDFGAEFFYALIGTIWVCIFVHIMIILCSAYGSLSRAHNFFSSYCRVCVCVAHTTQ